MTGPAVFSPDRQHRYVLRRHWLGDAGTCCWVMLNPSIADETRNDRTVARCVTFTKSWGHSGLAVVNLFSYRTPYPTALLRARRAGIDIIGDPANLDHIFAEAAAAQRVVLAWGAHRLARDRGRHVVERLRAAGIVLHHLCLTPRTGQPQHPLFVPGGTVPTLYEGATAA